MLTETIVLGALWAVTMTLISFIGKMQIDKVDRAVDRLGDHDKRVAILENRRTETRIDKLDSQYLTQTVEMAEVKQALFEVKSDVHYIREALDDLRGKN